MKCLRCEADNAEHRRFCRSCGDSLVAACQSCAFSNGAGDHYCGGCGGSLTAGETGRRAVAQSTGRPAAPTKAAITKLPAMDLSALLPRPVSVPAASPLPDTVSQDDLNALFGGSQA